MGKGCSPPAIVWRATPKVKLVLPWGGLPTLDPLKANLEGSLLEVRQGLIGSDRMLTVYVGNDCRFDVFHQSQVLQNQQSNSESHFISSFPAALTSCITNGLS